MALNVKLLRQVKRQILKEPAQFVMDLFFAQKEDIPWTSDLERSEIPNCGTAACIAGWTVALSQKKKPVDAQGLAWDDAEVASEHLGLDNGQGAELFYTENWPQELRDQFFASRTLKGRARVAARRIDAFIKEHRD